MMNRSDANNCVPHTYNEVLNGRNLKADQRLILDLMRHGPDPLQGKTTEIGRNAGRHKTPGKLFMKSDFVLPVSSRLKQLLTKKSSMKRPCSNNNK